MKITIELPTDELLEMQKNMLSKVENNNKEMYTQIVTDWSKFWINAMNIATVQKKA